MNALKLLESQHHEVDELFGELEATGDDARKAQERLCGEIADALAVHSEIEEKLFYPEAKDAAPDVEELLREAVEEHLSVKRLVADILEKGVDDESFHARMKVLAQQVRHHVAEEEHELFPEVERALDEEALDALGDRMQEMADDLEAEGEPSARLAGETDEPAPL